MEQQPNSSEGQAPVDPHAPPPIKGGKIINGAFFSDEDLSEFSEQNFLEPMSQMEKELMPRISAVRFVTHCLPTILDPRGTKREANGKNNDLTWLNMWAQEISENTRLPVILTGEDGAEEYIIPPPMGTIHTSRTGHQDSIEGRYNYMLTHHRHLISHGNAIQAKLFNKIQLSTEENALHRGDWLRLLADTGMLAADFPSVAEHYRSKEPTSVTRFVNANKGAVAALVAVETESGAVRSAHPAENIVHMDPPSATFTGSGGVMDYD